jgi:DNA-binding NarL/FixJ family response regulator
MNTPEIRIVLVEDHAMVRSGLRYLLEKQPGLRVVGEAANGCGALEQVRLQQPQVVIMDIHLGCEDGIDISKVILSSYPTIKILALSADTTLVHQALRAGMSGYLTKAAAVEELMQAIETILENRIYLGAQIANRISPELKSELEKGTQVKLDPHLTENERQILRGLVEGKHSREIAAALNMKPDSVDNCRLRLKKKTGCANMAEMVRFALREGLAES